MISPRLYHGRIVAAENIAADTRVISVELENKARLNFLPGQYAHLSVAGFEPRPFSIASSPQEVLLEFHIKSAGRGLSAHIVEHLKPGDAITVEGPFGESHWRETGRPLLLLAGGLGIAPAKSIIDSCLGDHPPLTLYWGVRDAEHLYLDGYFRRLAAKHRHFAYIPVIAPRLIGEAVAEDFDNLSGYSIYLAGSRAFAEATVPALLHRGAEENYIFSDAFTV